MSVQTLHKWFSVHLLLPFNKVNKWETRVSGLQVQVIQYYFGCLKWNNTQGANHDPKSRTLHLSDKVTKNLPHSSICCFWKNLHQYNTKMLRETYRNQNQTNRQMLTILYCGCVVLYTSHSAEFMDYVCHYQGKDRVPAKGRPKPTGQAVKTTSLLFTSFWCILAS